MLATAWALSVERPSTEKAKARVQGSSVAAPLCPEEGGIGSTWCGNIRWPPRWQRRVRFLVKGSSTKRGSHNGTGGGRLGGCSSLPKRGWYLEHVLR